MTTTTQNSPPLPPRRGPARLPTAVRARPPAELWAWALVAVPTAALFVLGYRRRWICDDGMIYLRPVRQILAGHGPVFNVGERAESSTGALWQWMLALGGWTTGTDPAFLAVGAGLLLSTAGFACALMGTVRLHARGTPLLPAGVLVLLGVPPVWSYMTSGLESGLGTGWTGCAWLLLTRVRRGRSGRAALLTSAVFGLGWLVRPDLTLVTVCFLGAQLLVLRPSPLRAAGLLGAAAVLPLGYEVFRAGYYGVLLPLPAIAKEASASDWARGARYAQETLGPYWLWPALALVALAALRTPRSAPVSRPPGGPSPAVVAAPLVAGVLLALYVMRVGGDYMHARMVLPALFVVLLPVLVVPVSRYGVLAGGLLLVWLAAAVSPLRQPFDLAGSEGTFNVRMSDIHHLRDHNPVRSSAWVRHLPERPELRVLLAHAVRGRRPALVYFDARRIPRTAPLRADSPYHVVVVGRYLGATGAAAPLDAYVNDAWGLASPTGAHLVLGRASWPGHEKFLRVPWILADWAADPLPPAALRQAGTSRRAVSAARAAYRCGQLAELRDSVRAPLTADRLWRNLAGSWERTRFRFARAAVDARRELCGVGR